MMNNSHKNRLASYNDIQLDVWLSLSIHSDFYSNFLDFFFGIFCGFCVQISFFTLLKYLTFLREKLFVFFVFFDFLLFHSPFFLLFSFFRRIFFQKRTKKTVTNWVVKESHVKNLRSAQNSDLCVTKKMVMRELNATI